jgi:hypothetical protein
MNPVFGWIYDPAEISKYLAMLAEPNFAQACPRLVGTPPTDIFLWEFEEKVLGKQLPPWNQLQVGSCVSHGSGRGAQDVLIIQIAQLGTEEWPGAEVCREEIYGGSRVQIGGQGGMDDGSTGSWAAKWVSEYGIILYQSYPGHEDLTGGYTEQRCREWGNSGCPKDLEPTAKLHPVKQVTQATKWEQARDLLLNAYPVVICGSVSRPMQRSEGGWCRKTGNNWPHCQELCGFCIVKGGEPAFVYRNSWGDYLGSTNNQVQLESGRVVTLPPGTYLGEVQSVDEDLRQGDSFGYGNEIGWPRRKPLDWLI